jgi:hypothetical protein
MIRSRGEDKEVTGEWTKKKTDIDRKILYPRGEVNEIIGEGGVYRLSVGNELVYDIRQVTSSSNHILTSIS